VNVNENKLLRIGSGALQIALLVGVFVGLGLLAPTYIAPTLFRALPVAGPQEQSANQWSLRVANRNADTGESLSLAVRSPTDAVHISGLEYSCDISGVQLVYETEQTTKQLPCGTEVLVPDRSDHKLRVYTDRTAVAYLPVTVTVEQSSQHNGDPRSRDISVVLATSRVDTNEKSRVSDRAVVTVDDV